MSVYSLSDPRTGKVRYIGASIQPLIRLRQHLSGSSSIAVRQWCGELRSVSMAPDFAILGPGTEAEWIARLRPDLNLMPGVTDETPDGSANDERIDFRLPSDERELFFEAAKAESLPLSLWVRRTLKAAAQRILKRVPGERDAPHGKRAGR